MGASLSHIRYAANVETHTWIVTSRQVWLTRSNKRPTRFINVPSSAMAESVRELIDRFIAAIERGDVDTVLKIYADDATIWHNYDNLEVTAQDNARQIRWFSTRLAGMQYTDIRRIDFPGGLIQQHVLQGTAPNGDVIELHAMLKIEVQNGRIARLEEYLDPAQAASLALPGPTGT